MKRFPTQVVTTIRFVSSVKVSSHLTLECDRRLDSNNLTEKNSEVYCKHCYGKLFGPKGFGFGNTLSTETKTTKLGGSSNSINAGSNARLNAGAQGASGSASKLNDNSSDVQKSAEDLVAKLAGTNTCIRCQKQVYHAEQQLGPGGTKL